nr:MAG TPA: hypothetical protein [Caudoviricetes sp.]
MRLLFQNRSWMEKGRANIDHYINNSLITIIFFAYLNEIPLLKEIVRVLITIYYIM